MTSEHPADRDEPIRVAVARAIALLPPAAQASVTIRDRHHHVVEHEPHLILSTASVGKVLALIALARHITAGRLNPLDEVTLDPDLTVGGDGLLQHLTATTVSIADLAVLTASVSDNIAFNHLQGLLGPDAIAATTVALGLADTALHDRVRNTRTPEHPPRLSSGSSAELASLMRRLHTSTLLDHDTSDLVDHWLSLNADLTGVADPLGFDPLTARPDLDVVWRNKTGRSLGVAADTGYLAYHHRAVAYAVVINWDETSNGGRDAVTACNRRIGQALWRYVH